LELKKKKKDELDGFDFDEGFNIEDAFDQE